MACGKKIFCECVACVYITFRTSLLVTAFFMALGILVGVTTISFAPPIGFYKPLWNLKMVSLQKFFSKRY